MSTNSNLLEGRNLKERLTDKLLLTYLIGEYQKIKKSLGFVKLNKLVFFSERSMIQEKIKGFNYRFIRYELGPFSKDIYADTETLLSNEIISENGKVVLAKNGKRFLSMCRQLFEENLSIMKKIDNTIQIYGKMGTFEIMDEAYDVKIETKPSKWKKIKWIDRRTEILNKIDEKEADISFKLDDDWFETVIIHLDKEIYSSLEQALKSAKTERSLTHEEVFGKNL